MKERGVHISRARWSYMRAGTGPMTTNGDLLDALANFFGVSVEHLTEEDSEVPARVQAQLDLLRSMKEAEIKTFAARSLSCPRRRYWRSAASLPDLNTSKATKPDRHTGADGGQLGMMSGLQPPTAADISIWGTF